MTGILIAATAFAAGSALAERWSEVGNRLNKAVDAYNSPVATLESRVLVSARLFRELKAAPEGIEIGGARSNRSDDARVAGAGVCKHHRYSEPSMIFK